MWERTRTRTGIEFEKKVSNSNWGGGNSRCVCVRFFFSIWEGEGQDRKQALTTPTIFVAFPSRISNSRISKTTKQEPLANSEKNPPPYTHLYFPSIFATSPPAKYTQRWEQLIWQGFSWQLRVVFFVVRGEGVSKISFSPLSNLTRLPFSVFLSGSISPHMGSGSLTWLHFPDGFLPTVSIKKLVLGGKGMVKF